MKENFETDYNLLIEQKRKNLEIKKFLLENEFKLKEKCEEFLNKYNKDSINKDTLYDIVNRRIEYKEFLYSINKLDRSELENFNIEGSKNEYSTTDSIEGNNNINNLNYANENSHYLINNELLYYLKMNNPLKGEMLFNGEDKNQFFNMVVFNVIRIDDNPVLIYNYISYNKLLFILFYAYISIEQKSFLYSLNNSGYISSDYFFVMDNELIKENPKTKIIDIELIKRFDFYKNIMNDELFMFKNLKNVIQLCKFYTKGNLYNINIEENLKILEYIFYRDDYKLINLLNNDHSENSYEDSSNYNLIANIVEREIVYKTLTRFIFVVSDLDKFIKIIREKYNIDINQGSQKYRGKNSYISYILYEIDKGFRDSMYNHHKSYVDANINN